jgi:hypothetical protein
MYAGYDSYSYSQVLFSYPGSKGRMGALIPTLSADKMVQIRQTLLFALGFGD